jgi:ATP-dependent phosphoenolpyruvate carboxykinase
MNSFDLKEHELTVAEVHRNLAPSALYELAILYEKHAHSGAMAATETQSDPFFGVGVITQCPNVPPEILVPRNAWLNKAAYAAMAKKLAILFRQNFAVYEAGVSGEVKAANPAG